MRVAVIQQKNQSDLQANLEHSLSLIREAADQGAELVLLQELHRSLYFCQTEDTAVFDLAETIPGPSTDTLGKLARSWALSLSAVCSKNGPPVFTTTPPW